MYSAVCEINSPKINGTVLFRQYPNTETIVSFFLTGPPMGVHAVHIHEYGDLRRGCDSLGPHYNPDELPHGSYYYDGLNHHAGDLINNVSFDKQGLFVFEYSDPLLDVEELYGRSVVFHAKVDDLGLGGNRESKITGNAGDRIACGIIGRSEH
jgi:Cu/Zn superoxide dismutase